MGLDPAILLSCGYFGNAAEHHCQRKQKNQYWDRGQGDKQANMQKMLENVIFAVRAQ